MGCWKHLSKNMDLAQFLLSTRAKAAISLVFGSATKRTQKDTMDPLRRQRLEALPGWSWDVFSDQWEEGFAHLKEFSVRVGHCRVPFTYKSDDNYGTWYLGREPEKKLDPVHRQRLEALPGWSWDVFSDRWEEGFAHLKEFSGRVGHCRVPATHKSDNGYRLGRWISTQRGN